MQQKLNLAIKDHRLPLLCVKKSLLTSTDFRKPYLGLTTSV